MSVPRSNVPLPLVSSIHRHLYIVIVLVMYTIGCSRQSRIQGPGSTAVPPKATLNVDLVPQLLTNWCWAASGEMAMQYLGKPVLQCDEANVEFGHHDCCPANNSCNFAGWPQFEKYQFAVLKTCRRAISWDQLKEEIANKRPVVFSWLWGSDSPAPIGDPACVKGGPGHMMVVTGYEESSGKQLVYYNDPIYPNGKQYSVTYQDFAGASTDHHHWNDFYMIKDLGVKP